MESEPPTERCRLEDIARQIDVSTTSLNGVQEYLREYGLLERTKDPSEHAMPECRIPDSTVVRLLRSFHTGYDPTEYPYVNDEEQPIFLPKLMNSDGRARLIGWFLTRADPNEQNSKGEIVDAAPVGNTTVRGEIDTLADYGIVSTEKAWNGSQSYTEYQFNVQSNVVDILRDLDEAAATHSKTY